MAKKRKKKRVRTVYEDMQKIVDILYEAMEDASKFDDGVQAPATRVRKALQDVKNEAQALRLKIMENNRLFPYISAMEDGVDWLHVDCRNTPSAVITLFKKK